MNFILLLASCLAVASAVDFVPAPEPSPGKLPVLPVPIPEGRITNGETAGRTQFKYQVGLSLRASNGTYWCGGTLVSDRWIVTAAHCTKGILSVNVYLGAWNRTDSQEVGQQIVFAGQRYIYVHEQYDNETIKNDIALIKLPSPIRLNDYIQPAKLPKYRADEKYATFEGVNATASGWGVTEEGRQPQVLKYIVKPIMKYSSCNRFYFGTIRATEHICINVSNKQSTCNGDSGGPLVIQEDGKPVLVGATSFGFALGCQSGWPGVFTRVTAYLKWIHEKTGLVEGL